MLGAMKFDMDDDKDEEDMTDEAKLEKLKAKRKHSSRMASKEKFRPVVKAVNIDNKPLEYEFNGASFQCRQADEVIRRKQKRLEAARQGKGVGWAEHKKYKYA